MRCKKLTHARGSKQRACVDLVMLEVTIVLCDTGPSPKDQNIQMLKIELNQDHSIFYDEISRSNLLATRQLEDSRFITPFLHAMSKC